VRIVGSAISPNGIGLSNQGMISIAFLDKVCSPLAFHFSNQKLPTRHCLARAIGD
jgi:hypothetical protein